VDSVQEVAAAAGDLAESAAEVGAELLPNPRVEMVETGNVRPTW
jgi:hypothetical protein